jgi:phosphonoacetate hydrolase
MKAGFPDKVIIFMIDGFDIGYYHASDMPVMRRMAREGFFKAGSCIFPSLTNANNISIACASWPDVHGVTTNCYYDHERNQAVFLEDSSFLCTPTIFEMAAGAGKASALLTCKAKTTLIMGKGASVSVAAETPQEEFRQKYGTPPPMYSAEINYWLFDVGLDLLQTRPDLDLIYIHTTDYPMHKWAPEQAQSLEYMKTLDDYLGRFCEAAPDYTIALTSDHGMNSKKRCWDLAKACRNRGFDLKFAVSPVADRLLEHHGGFGGVSYLYLHNPHDHEGAIETLMQLKGVEAVLDGPAAGQRFNLMTPRIGDLVVFPDRDTVFGDLPEESRELPPDYRSHGSLYEMDIPLLLFNSKQPNPRYRDINYNVDLTRRLFKQDHSPKR